jgi:general secretion pathway protein D
MDKEPPAGRGRFNAIPLKYISAEETAKSISALLKHSENKDEGGPVRSRVAIEANASNNSLLVDASAGDFEVIKRLIDQLDTVPQQVHIGVIIAELTVSDELDLGVEMAALDLPSDEGSTVVQGSSRFSEGADSLMDSVQKNVFPRGITVAAAHGVRLDNEGNIVVSFPGIISLDAIRKNGRFEILSETSLEAQNNREASVNIVDDIPFLTSTIRGTGTERDVIQTIERMEVGIKLKLTPHIIPDGKVQMALNPSIEAVLEPGPGGDELIPTIARREVSTTVTVPDGEMIVIAGLTRKDQTKIVKKVPVLGSIPLVGVLFRDTADAVKKTDLLIFVAPRIVTDMAAAESVMQEWHEKTGLKPHEDR